jgi:hypothetical protein
VGRVRDLFKPKGPWHNLQSRATPAIATTGIEWDETHLNDHLAGSDIPMVLDRSRAFNRSRLAYMEKDKIVIPVLQARVN